jgi:hypothetical protein
MTTQHPSLRNPGIDCPRLVTAFAVIALQIGPSTFTPPDLLGQPFCF